MLGAFFIEIPIGVTKKGFSREQELHTPNEMDMVFATTENWAMTVDTLRKNDF